MIGTFKGPLNSELNTTCILSLSLVNFPIIYVEVTSAAGKCRVHFCHKASRVPIGNTSTYCSIVKEAHCSVGLRMTRHGFFTLSEPTFAP